MDLYLKMLLDQKAEALKNSRSILETAEKEKRALNAEEQGKYDGFINEISNISKTAEAHKRQLELEKEGMEREQRAADAEKATQAGKATSAEERELLGFRNFLRYGERSNADGVAEFRAKQVDNNTEGGYLVAPETFISTLIRELDTEVFMRSLSTVYSLPNAVSLGAPTIETKPDDAVWTNEIQTVSEETGLRFGKRQLTPHALRQLVKMSSTLIRKAPNTVGLVQNEIRRRTAIVMENAFLTGNGNLRPLGVFTASSDGISTSRDVSTANLTTAVKADNLRNVFYSLKAPHRRNASWIMHRDVIKQISLEKDGNGQYLWTPGLRAGDPDLILGRPVYESEYAPNTLTTGQYVGILGDFSYYWIADSLEMRMQVLDQLYAENNQIGYITQLESDGMPVLEEAFVRMKLA